MKYIIIGIVIVVIIFILYNLVGNKKKNDIVTQHSTSIETNDIPTSGILTEINSEEYNRFILTKNTTENYLLEGIKEFGELSGNTEYEIYNYSIAQYGDWKIIKLEESVSFYDYHNIVGWLTGYNENTETPELSIGFAKNKTDSLDDYLFFLDPENEFGDTQIGTFRSEKSFSIYLPDAYEKYGNLTVKNDIIVSMQENIQFISDNGLDIEKVLSLKYAEYKIKMSE